MQDDPARSRDRDYAGETVEDGASDAAQPTAANAEAVPDKDDRGRNAGTSTDPDAEKSVKAGSSEKEKSDSEDKPDDGEIDGSSLKIARDVNSLGIAVPEADQTKLPNLSNSATDQASATSESQEAIAANPFGSTQQATEASASRGQPAAA